MRGRPGLPSPVCRVPARSLPALTLSGLPNDRFLFAGFLPVKDKARHDALADVATVAATLIFYETGPRLVKSLAAIAAILPDREVSVARELTKLFEECRTGTPDELAAHYAAHPPKGEIVLMIGPAAGGSFRYRDADAMLRRRADHLKASQAAAQVAKATGLDRKALYARAMELKGAVKRQLAERPDGRARGRLRSTFSSRAGGFSTAGARPRLARSI